MTSDPRIRLEHVACALCGADDADTALVGRDNEHDLMGSFTVVTCRRCGHNYTDPRPTADSIDALYPEEYGSFSARRAGRSAALRDRYVHLLQFGERMRDGGGELLEVGCGSGANLAAHAARGWSARGIEPSASAVAVARGLGLDVSHGTETQIDELPSGRFTEVQALMVLEHVPDPLATLRRMHRVGAAGARLVVSVPCFASGSRRRFGADWYALQVPRHFHHFTEPTLRHALEQTGWRIERVWYQPTTADWCKSLALATQGRRWGPLVARATRLRGLVDLAMLPLLVAVTQRRTSSRMTVIARRVDLSDR